MKTILIVDDSLFTRTIHRQILKGQGYATIEAGCGVEALQVFSDQKPDLVMVDLLLPDMDGMEVIRRLQAQKPGVKTVICSTDKQSARQKIARKEGVLAFLVKPINAEKMVSVLKEILDVPQPERSDHGRITDE